MKRRGFLAALGALPFVGRIVKRSPAVIRSPWIAFPAGSIPRKVRIFAVDSAVFMVAARNVRVEPKIELAGLEAWLPDPSDPYWTGPLDRYPKLS